MRRKTQIWPLRIALVLLTVLAAYFILPHMASAFRQGFGVFSSVLLLLAYLFALVALPLGVFALLKFGYSLFARPYIRLRRIRRIRYARYMREAVKRGQFKVIVNPRRANSDPRQFPPAGER
jgi:hypothetical protein